MNSISLILLVGLCFLSGYLIFYFLEIKKMKEQLREILPTQTNQELRLTSRNKQLRSLTQEINLLLRKNKAVYQEMEASREQFEQAIHNIAHDLRTPLTVASGYTQFLLSSPEMPTNEQKEMLTKIGGNLLAVENRLEKLLEYRRLAEGQQEIQLTKVNLSQLTERYLLNFYESFVSQGIDFQLAIAPNLVYITDEQLYQRILQNIFGNILNHGCQAGKISLTETPNEIILQVGNQTEQEITNYEQLFSRFYTEDLARKNKNAGLGLYIVKELVDLLGAEVRLSGQDSWFEIEIKFKKEEADP